MVDVPGLRSTRRAAFGAFAALAASLAGLGGCDRLGGGPGGAFKSIDITGADYARALTLPDTDGRPRTLAEFKGKIVVLFFGYTHCPDVCPTTMAEVAAVKQALGPAGAKVQVIFVSVDPERDTPTLLKAYTGNFGPDFLALRGTPEETQATAKAFKIFYAKTPGKTPESYTVDHSALSYVYDTQGRLRLATRYGTGPAALESDIRRLLDEAG